MSNRNEGASEITKLSLNLYQELNSDLRTSFTARLNRSNGWKMTKITNKKTVMSQYLAPVFLNTLSLQWYVIKILQGAFWEGAVHYLKHWLVLCHLVLLSIDWELFKTVLRFKFLLGLNFLYLEYIFQTSSNFNAMIWFDFLTLFM